MTCDCNEYGLKAQHLDRVNNNDLLGQHIMERRGEEALALSVQGGLGPRCMRA